MSVDIGTLSKAIALIGTVASGSYAAIQAGLNWREKTVESQRLSRERRMTELRNLVTRREACQPILDEIFDYNSSLDVHLRLDDLVFGPEETATRARADRAFEHFRDVHRSVTMKLIEPDDLGPWIYWIHRVGTRPVLKEYSEACGYGAFMNELAKWTENSKELELLEANCPWWTRPRSTPRPKAAA